MRARALASAVMALTFLSGCGAQPKAAIEISSRDVVSSSVTTTTPSKYLKVVALANGSAEIIDSFGLKKILVGRDIASTDESLASVPIVTSGHQVIAEKIISLAPDLVLIDSSVGPLQALTAIRKAGIRVESINEVWTVGAITSKVNQIAEILGVASAGGELSNQIGKAIAAASARVTGKPRVAFLYLRGGNSIYLLGGKGSGADSILESLGTIDVGAVAGSRPFSALTSESLIGKKPEIILVMSKGLESVGGVDGLVKLPGIAQTPAGKSHRVIAVDDSLLLSFGPRTPSMLSKLAAALNEVRK
jgi:iron complex transport system substrate-binding protein